MRPLVLASVILLVLSGCATAEPEVQVDATTQSQSSSTPESQEGTDSGEAPDSTQEPQPSESAATNEDSVAEEQDDLEGSSATQQPETRETESPAETEEPEPTQTPSATATEEPSAEPEVIGFTLAEVSQKDSAAECWVAIDGGVYDLTRWIQSHPGGAGAITQLCGTDGTAQFLGQHGGQSRPSSTLDGYFIGPLR